MEAYGGPGGVVGELYDGQARINQSNLQVSKGSYCLSKGGESSSSPFYHDPSMLTFSSRSADR